MEEALRERCSYHGRNVNNYRLEVVGK